MSDSYNVQTISFFQSNNSTPPVTTSGYANTMTVQLPVPIELVDSEVALSSIFCYYSWPNISDQLQNNKFSYTVPTAAGSWVGTDFNVETTKTLGKIDDGLYTIDDLNNVLAFTFKNNGHYYLDGNGSEVYPITLQVNPATYRITATFSKLYNPLPTGWANAPGSPAAFTSLNNVILRLNIPTTSYPAGSSSGFGMSSISRIFGVAVGTWPSDTEKTTPDSTVDISYSSTFVPSVSNTNCVNVTCNLVNASKISPVAGNIIYSFAPNSTSGTLVQEKPNNLIWLPVTDGKYGQIQITLETDSFIPLQIQDPAVSCTLMLRTKRSASRQKRGYDAAMSL